VDVRLVRCSSATTPSRLPGLDRALNPYRGCAHSCAYCYAQDVTRFETDRPWGSVVEVKVNIVQRLKRELERGLGGVYGVGTVTDPYQPLEARYQLTRGCLSMLKRYGAQASVLTKSDLVTRDLDLFRGWEGVEVGVSIACLDERVARVVEPGATPPRSRFEALSELVGEGVDVYLMAAPILPGISDSKRMLEALMGAAADAGVGRVMWDPWNPKPIAARRLSRVMEKEGMVKDGANTSASAELRALCSALDLQLVDAF
jgi:DNA repair photolyase